MYHRPFSTSQIAFVIVRVRVRVRVLLDVVERSQPETPAPPAPPAPLPPRLWHLPFPAADEHRWQPTQRAPLPCPHRGPEARDVIRIAHVSMMSA